MLSKKLVLVRHGESEWNQKNKFTGWYDVKLSKNGINEAIKAGKLLKEKKFNFDYSYTSLLKRAINTLNIILDQLELSWIPCKKTWFLNERHYGSLQGLNKLDTEKKYGSEQLYLWRRSYKHSPPEMKENFLFSGFDRRYLKIEKNNLPKSESLEKTFERVILYWNKKILPNIKNGKKILIVAHGNSLRALIKYLSKINDSDIADVIVPTGVPLIYEFDKKMNVMKKYFL
ncbi:MAG: 2,3-diphosphoglycerate-dependent phosphoglycerate mutase [Buchnera aphidicola (Tetraneura akinire)]